MTNDMTNNVSNSNIMDFIYYAIPNDNNDFPLLIIIDFDSIKRKSKLIFIGLIKNANIETFTIMIRYLKENYKFQPKFIVCDCSSDEIISIRKELPLCKIILCIQNLVRKLSLLSNKNIKKRALDLLDNIKMLLFINKNNIELFFKKIFEEYKSDFFKFLKYFCKHYFIKFPIDDRI